MTTKYPVDGAPGRVVAITGGARGIGRATATAFSAAGANVGIGDLDLELAEKAAAEISAQTGYKVEAFALDVTSADSFEQFVVGVERELGELDILVNNAGIMPTGLFAEEDPALTERIIDINLRGVINGSRAAVARFLPRGRGVIVNVASLAGTTGFAALATYCATKHAVIGFSESLCQEMLPHGVQVVVVLPGVVRTELSAGASMKKWMAPIATVDPEDVGAAIVQAIGRRPFKVMVPRRLGTMLFTMSLLPTRARRWADHVSGTDIAYTQADPRARAIYHDRLRSQAD